MLVGFILGIFIETILLIIFSLCRISTLIEEKEKKLWKKLKK